MGHIILPLRGRINREINIIIKKNIVTLLDLTIVSIIIGAIAGGLVGLILLTPLMIIFIIGMSAVMAAGPVWQPEGLELILFFAIVSAVSAIVGALPGGVSGGILGFLTIILLLLEGVKIKYVVWVAIISAFGCGGFGSFIVVASIIFLTGYFLSM